MELRLHIWTSSLLLNLLGLLLQTDFGRAQRVVTIEKGPLYRIKGFPVSIKCSVSNFEGPAEQTFHFSAYKPSRPSQEIEIVSTIGDSYGYAVYQGRVRSREIWIERLTGSSVIFHINKTLIEDTAEIECHTPNTDSRYYGTYTAKTSLHVVEDTLSATYSGPSSLDLFEGDTLQLECLASSQTFQHTHLSVTYLLQSSSGGEPRPIISLDRDLTVRPGEGYDARYQSRQVAIEKVEETQYRLRMTQVQQADQGKIFCRVQEWIQDPDRSWFNVASKDAQGVDVTIKTVEVAEDSFAARIKVTKADLQEGEEMEVRCSVEAQNLPELFFTVAWFKGDQEVARVGPLGMLTVLPGYSARSEEGELRAAKTTDKDYVLTLRPARTEDQGEYQCRVWQEKRGEKGGFTQGQLQRSQPQQVTITAKESGLVVSMEPNLSTTEGSPLSLSCSVSGVHGELSVTWEYKKDTQGSTFSDVISLSQDGVTEVGQLFQQRAVRTFRLANGTVVLEMGDAEVGDGGGYKCTVSEWGRDNSGGLQRKASQSQHCSVAVTSLATLLKVRMRSRTVAVKVNDPIDIRCSVRSPRSVPLSVQWFFKQTGSKSEEAIVSVLHTGNVVWEQDRDEYQLSTELGEEDSVYNLEVNKASLRNGGVYQCRVVAYLKNIQRASQSSNWLGVQVNKKESTLSVTAVPASPLTTIINSDIQLSCKVASAISNASRFAVSWDVGGRTVASGDRNGVVSLPDNGKRTSVTTLSGGMFQLMLRQVDGSDSGRYLCMVEEWLQDTAGEWYSLPPQSASRQVVVNEKPSDFRMDQTLIETNAGEGEQIEIACKILSGRDDPSSHFALTWLFQHVSPESGSASGTTNTLLTYTQKGGLTYGDSLGGLQERLRFSRPDPGTFLLTVDKTELGDNGKYWCEVEQYQHCNDKWEKKGSQRSGQTEVRVKPIEAKLHVNEKNQRLNVTDLKAGFKVDCSITSRSSQDSLFEVTWFRTQGGKPKTAILKFTRNGTLQSYKARTGLVFTRPEVMSFTMTVPEASDADSGNYSCSVEELVRKTTTARKTMDVEGGKWKKVAEAQSGFLDVLVHTANPAAQSGASPEHVACAVLAILLLILIGVVAIMGWRFHKAKTEQKKAKGSLWAESNPLKPSAPEA
ncbi:immunoglobulin superfamily member 3-like isoform X2 [Engraulis encrasicolus]|uniref:immunoglobulin superfamily member 3-like isoform X2 n=1 Tax=Engraulis encrasicolus TaxID=184585 RepID=UPI002FD5C3D7